MIENGSAVPEDVVVRDGNKLTTTSSFVFEDVEIKNTLTFDLEKNTYESELSPSPDELVEKFPIGDSFSEFDAVKYFYAIDTGMMNIWRIYGKLCLPKFIIQKCPMHYKRFNAINNDDETLSFDAIYAFDEFYYVPNPVNAKGLYVIHKHLSPGTRRGMYVFIGTVDKESSDNLDSSKGGVFLESPKHDHLMKFDFTNPSKLGRKLQILSAMG
jgi:hypothetical protein